MTLRQSGPTWSNEGDSGNTPRALTRPDVGFNPTIPQNAAGSRTEPPVSVPIAAKHMPVATAAAEPPEEPPAMRSVSHGLRTGPKYDDVEVPPYANSCMFCFPINTAPARFRRCTM